MKRKIILVFISIFIILALNGCSNSSNGKTPYQNSEKKSEKGFPKEIDFSGEPLLFFATLNTPIYVIHNGYTYYNKSNKIIGFKRNVKWNEEELSYTVDNIKHDFTGNDEFNPNEFYCKAYSSQRGEVYFDYTSDDDNYIIGSYNLDTQEYKSLLKTSNLSEIIDLSHSSHTELLDHSKMQAVDNYLYVYPEFGDDHLKINLDTKENEIIKSSHYVYTKDYKINYGGKVENLKGEIIKSERVENIWENGYPYIDGNTIYYVTKISDKKKYFFTLVKIDLDALAKGNFKTFINERNKTQVGEIIEGTSFEIGDDDGTYVRQPIVTSYIDGDNFTICYSYIEKDDDRFIAGTSYNIKTGKVKQIPKYIFDDDFIASDKAFVFKDNYYLEIPHIGDIIMSKLKDKIHEINTSSDESKNLYERIDLYD